MSGFAIGFAEVDGGEEGRERVDRGDDGGEVMEGAEDGGDRGREVVGGETGDEGREVSEEE